MAFAIVLDVDFREKVFEEKSESVHMENRLKLLLRLVAHYANRHEGEFKLGVTLLKRTSGLVYFIQSQHNNVCQFLV
jgi:hypothetical protein